MVWENVMNAETDGLCVCRESGENVVGKVLVQYFIRTVESGLPTLSRPLNYSSACPSLLSVNRKSVDHFRVRSAPHGGM